MESPCGGFTIHTQHGFRTDDTPIGEEEGTEPNDADGKRGCYDLVMLPELLTSAALIFELKAWSGFRRNQLADYRAAVKKAFPGYADYRILTVTPFRDKPTGADNHVPWAAVTKALQESDPTHVVLQQFAQFLTNKKTKFYDRIA